MYLIKRAVRAIRDLMYSIVDRQRGPAHHDENETSEEAASHERDTVLARYARNYLALLGVDHRFGVSVFVRGRRGAPTFVELSCVPRARLRNTWKRSADSELILEQFQAHKSRLAVYVAAPLLLVRLGKPSKAAGKLLVVPLLLWRVQPSQNRKESLNLLDPAPIVNPTFIQFQMGLHGQSMMVEATRVSKELGLTGATNVDLKQLSQRTNELISKWPIKEPIDFTRSSSGSPLSGIDEPGIYNRVAIVTAERSRYDQGIRDDLRRTALQDMATIGGTALGSLVLGSSPPLVNQSFLPSGDFQSWQLRLKRNERETSQSSVTAFDIAPGSGRTVFITNIILNALSKRKKVLYVSKCNGEVDRIVAAVNGCSRRPTLLRLGSQGYQDRIPSFMRSASAEDYETPEGNFNSLSAEFLDDETLNSLIRLSVKAEHVSEYLSLSESPYDSDGEDSRFYVLQTKLIEMAPAIAVTYHSLGDRIGLKYGFYDVVVIDEADAVASAYVLSALARAKCAVIIGDGNSCIDVSENKLETQIELQAIFGFSSETHRGPPSDDSALEWASKILPPAAVFTSSVAKTSESAGNQRI